MWKYFMLKLNYIQSSRFLFNSTHCYFPSACTHGRAMGRGPALRNKTARVNTLHGVIYTYTQVTWIFAGFFNFFVDTLMMDLSFVLLNNRKWTGSLCFIIYHEWSTHEFHCVGLWCFLFLSSLESQLGNRTLKRESTKCYLASVKSEILPIVKYCQSEILLFHHMPLLLFKK